MKTAMAPDSQTTTEPVNPGSLLLASATTIFVGSFLLFQVQPVIARYILPWFGGTPALWTTCMLFFQVLLLAGSGYAHFIQRTSTTALMAASNPLVYVASDRFRCATGNHQSNLPEPGGCTHALDSSAQPVPGFIHHLL